MTVVERKYRLGLLRFLNRKPEGEWVLFGEMLQVAEEEGIWSKDEREWYRLAMRECVLLGEVKMDFLLGGQCVVRIKEKGRQAIAIEEVIR